MAPGNLVQAKLHQDPVLIDKGHHIGNRSEGHQVEIPLYVGHVLLEIARIPQSGAERQRKIEGDTNSRQPLEGERTPRLLRVYYCHGRGRHLRHLVVVRYDYIQVETIRIGNLVTARNPGIGRHDELRPPLRQVLQSATIQAVPLLQPLRYIEVNLHTNLSEK